MTTSAITLGLAKNEIESVSQGLRSATSMLRIHAGVWSKLIIIRFQLLRNIQMNTKMRKLIRSKLGSCNVLCEDATCLPDICKAAEGVAENYAELIEILSDFPIVTFGLICRLANMEMAEWQELADDCTLAADPEFRGLVHSVAAHL